MREKARHQYALYFAPDFGSGFPSFTRDWRRYLYPCKTARENLRELLGNTKKGSYPLEKLKVEDVVVNMQNTLRVRFFRELLAGEFFTHAELRAIAMDLLRDAGLKIIDDGKPSSINDVLMVPFDDPFGPLMTHIMWGTGVVLRKMSRLLSLQSKTVTLSLLRRTAKMHYYERPGEGPTFLLIHGGLTTAVCWFLTIPFIKGRVIAVDACNFANGFSSSTPMPEGVIEHVEHLEAFIASPGILPESGPFIVVGHSFGALLVWHLAQRKNCPQISHVVMISPVLSTWSYIWGNNPLIVVNHNAIKNSMPRWLDIRIQTLLARMFTQPELANIISGSEWMEFHGSGASFDGTPLIIGDIPVMLLWGTHDDLCIPRTGDHLYGAFKHACPHRLSQAYWIDGGTHALVIDSPMLLGRLITHFSQPAPEPAEECFKGVIPIRNAIRTTMIRSNDDGPERPRVLIKAKSADTFMKIYPLLLDHEGRSHSGAPGMGKKGDSNWRRFEKKMEFNVPPSHVGTLERRVSTTPKNFDVRVCRSENDLLSFIYAHHGSACTSPHSKKKKEKLMMVRTTPPTISFLHFRDDGFFDEHAKNNSPNHAMTATTCEYNGSQKSPASSNFNERKWDNDPPSPDSTSTPVQDEDMTTLLSLY